MYIYSFSRTDDLVTIHQPVHQPVGQEEKEEKESLVFLSLINYVLNMFIAKGKKKRLAYITCTAFCL